MSHAIKVLFKILHNRLFRKCEAEIGYDQQKDICLYFMDLGKAFDSVNQLTVIRLATKHRPEWKRTENKKSVLAPRPKLE